MGKQHRETVSYRSGYTVAAVTRSLMFMLVFWFAGCAAGSCLSYGHSCWGAHGKRSGHNYPGNGPEDENRPSLSGSPSNDGQQPLHDQWILSRLVTRQLTVPGPEKFRGNWYDSSRGGRGGHGRNWESNDVAVVSDNAKPLRRDEIEIDDDDEEQDDLREETVILPRIMSRETREQVLEPRDISDGDADELLFVPPTDNHLKQTIGQSHKLRLFKILNGAAEKLK